jgi:hypothetical protein
MTIDERLSALTMNLELTARETADLRESVAELRKSMADNKGTVDALVQATSNLLKVSESQSGGLPG